MSIWLKPSAEMKKTYAAAACEFEVDMTQFSDVKMLAVLNWLKKYAMKMS